MDAAGRVAHRGEHASVRDGGDRRRHGIDASDEDVLAALRLHHIIGGERHVVIVEEGGIDLGMLGQQGFPDTGDLGHIPIGRLLVKDLHVGEFLDHRLEALGAALRTGMTERSLRHDDLTLAAQLVDKGLGHRSAHELIIGGEESVDFDRVERGDQRVEIHDGNAGIDHLFDRRRQCANAEGLDGDEIPLLRGHVVDGRALFHRIELAIEPGHFHVEELAPVFGGLLALGTPGGLQAGIGEGGLQRFFRPPGFLGESRKRGRQQGGGARHRGKLEKIAA